MEALDALGFVIAGAADHRLVVIDHISKYLYCQFKWNVHWFLRLESTEGLLIPIPFMLPSMTTVVVLHNMQSGTGTLRMKQTG